MTIYTSSFAPVQDWAKVSRPIPARFLDIDSRFSISRHRLRTLQENLYDFLFTNNANQVDSTPALIDAYSEEVVTYGELKARSLQFAHGLATKTKAKTIILFSPNTTVYPVLLFGGAAAGMSTFPCVEREANRGREENTPPPDFDFLVSCVVRNADWVTTGVTVSTANPGYTPEEFSHSLSLSGAEIVFVYSDPALIKTALEACKIAGIQPNIYLLPGADGTIAKGFRSWEELLGAENSGFKAVKFTEEELKTKIACTSSPQPSPLFDDSSKQLEFAR